MADYREAWFKENKSHYGWYTCVRCGKKIRKEDVDIDHIIPRSWGGRDNRNNLQCMCKWCNRSKGNDLGLHTIRDYSRNVRKNAVKDLKKTVKNLLK